MYSIHLYSQAGGFELCTFTCGFELYLQQSIVHIVEKSLLCSLFETPYSTYISRMYVYNMALL